MPERIQVAVAVDNLVGLVDNLPEAVDIAVHVDFERYILQEEGNHTLVEPCLQIVELAVK